MWLIFEIIDNPVFIGVISSLLFTFLLNVSKWVYKEHIHPWIQNKYYEGFDISGIWYEEKEILGNEIRQMSKIKIKQKGRNLSGNVKVVKNTGFEKIDRKRVFNLVGNVSNNVIVFSSICNDNREIGGQSYILKAVSTGNLLVGKKIYYDISSDFKINADNIDYFKHTDIVWYRKKNVNEFKEFIKKTKEEKQDKKEDKA